MGQADFLPLPAFLIPIFLNEEKGSKDEVSRAIEPLGRYQFTSATAVSASAAQSRRDQRSLRPWIRK